MTDTPYLTRAREWLEPKHYRNFITNSGAWNAHAANELAALLMQVRNEALEEAASVTVMLDTQMQQRHVSWEIRKAIRSLKEPRQ